MRVELSPHCMTILQRPDHPKVLGSLMISELRFYPLEPSYSGVYEFADIQDCYTNPYLYSSVSFGDRRQNLECHHVLDNILSIFSFVIPAFTKTGSFDSNSDSLFFSDPDGSCIIFVDKAFRHFFFKPGSEFFMQQRIE